MVLGTYSLGYGGHGKPAWCLTMVMVVASGKRPAARAIRQVPALGALHRVAERPATDNPDADDRSAHMRRNSAFGDGVWPVLRWPSSDVIPRKGTVVHGRTTITAPSLCSGCRPVW